MEDLWSTVAWLLQAWMAAVLLFTVLPAMFGLSLGVTSVYIRVLMRVLEWATVRIQRGQQEPTPKGIIERAEVSMEEELEQLRRPGGGFSLGHMFFFSKMGLEKIVDDQVTQSFSSEGLDSWNLLTRTNQNFHYISLRLTIIWGLGVLVRYGILFPFRITLGIIGLSWLVIGTNLVGFLPESRGKDWLSELVHLTSYRICARGLSASIEYQDIENRPQKGGICVANHTSPIDVVILANDGCYAMVGQVHGGLMGVMQRSMLRSCPHVWFERSEIRDRQTVMSRLKEHIEGGKKLPILIFPEGTCINNTSVLTFRKGSFEIGATIYPVAIKYDPRFCDAFWNSNENSMVRHLLRMMTSWAIVVKVYYLPPTTIQDGEDAAQFANRVKSSIAEQGGMLDLDWDGGLKRGKVKDSYREKLQQKYSSIILEGARGGRRGQEGQVKAGGTGGGRRGQEGQEGQVKAGGTGGGRRGQEGQEGAANPRR